MFVEVEPNSESTNQNTATPRLGIGLSSEKNGVKSFLTGQTVDEGKFNYLFFVNFLSYSIELGNIRMFDAVNRKRTSLVWDLFLYQNIMATAD